MISVVNKIIVNGKHIGYVSKSLAKDVAPLLNKGHKYKSVISEVTGGVSGKSFGCNYQITVFDKGLFEKLFCK